ncbi:MAG: sulfite exporter TauE/SafE family protein [Phycisphaerae bacterium]|nr:sulfite exporter TauE/SafE family protein [Phycisphaerae bacterium]
MVYLLLILLGFGVGAFGTLIGAGGGFILMPILLLAYPNTNPAALTAISLAVVFFNAASGSYSYARMKRIDFKSGWLFLVPGVPGAICGASVVHFIPRQAFNLVFGLFLLGGGSFVFLRTLSRRESGGLLGGTFQRSFADAEGTHHAYRYNLAVGMALSFAVGMVSSILGIGGGIIHVPAMTTLLGFPVHIATATSHFILAVMSLTATTMHVLDGVLGWAEAPRVLAIAVGAVSGAQLGARLSKRIHGRWILRGLAAALGLVGVRILLVAFRGT